MTGKALGERDDELIAREAELKQLSQAYHRLGQGRGQVVFLTGSTGVGKTALARAFVQRIRSLQSRVLPVSARCTALYSAHRPLGPFRDLIFDPLEPAVRSEIAGVVEVEAPAWRPTGEPSKSRKELFQQYLAIWRVLARDREVILFIDDWQWSDRSSLDLLAEIGATLGNLPLLVLIGFDSDFAADDKTLSEIQRRIGVHAVEIPVRELTSSGVRSLAMRKIGGSPGRSLTRWLEDLTRGNPLHVIQLLAVLQEKGALRKRLFRYSVRAEAAPTSVTRLQDVIEARVLEIEPAVRWTLEAAAWSVPIIEPAVVAAQIDESEGTALRRLRAADREYEILEGHETRSGSAAEASGPFRFRHPLFRQVLRVRTTPKRRQRLVERAGDAVAARAERAGHEVADELAALYLAAGPQDRTYTWTLRAADLAERLHASYELEALLRTAARAAPDDAGRARVEDRIAGLYMRSGRESEAERLLEGVYDRCRKKGDRANEVQAGVRLGWLQLARGVAPSELAALTARLVDSARQAEEPHALVPALDFACAVGIRLGRAEEALLMAEEALHVAEGADDRELAARAAYRLASVHVSFESPEEGRSLANRALETFTELGTARDVARCHQLFGTADLRAGHWDRALQEWTSALEILDGIAPPLQTLPIQLRIAEVAMLRGEFGPARDRLEAAIAAARELEDDTWALRARSALARLDFERGDYAAVIQQTEEIRADLPEGEFWREDFLTTAVRALAYLELGDELQAWQEATRLEQLYQGKDGWFEGRAEGDAVRLRVIDLDADPGLASMIADHGIRELAEKDRYGEAFLQYHRGLVMSRDDRGTAREAVERAVQLFTELQARPMLEKARVLLDSLDASGETERSEVREKAGTEEELTDEMIDQWFEGFEE